MRSRSPQSGQVRIKIQACGICHSDAVTKDGMFPWIQYPRIPGHEVVGTIDELGAGVSEWKQGQRVGIGWHGGHDGVCLYCRRGDFRNCKNVKIPGISYDGGYQQYMVAPVTALATIPEVSIPSKQRRCSALESRHTTRCATPALSPEILSRCRGSAVLVTSAFSTRASSATESRPSDAVRECVPRRETRSPHLH